MRISRKKRPDSPIIPIYRKNEGIRVPEVRVLGVEGENLGVMPTRDAIELARKDDMDLVEINPKGEPPVCKIIDFTHFKYQKEKEARKQKAKSHESEIKGIRLSVRISDHDLEIRVDQAEKFLGRGDKVKVEITLRGRENAKPSLAFDVIHKFKALLSTKVEVKEEQELSKQGNKVTVTYCKK